MADVQLSVVLRHVRKLVAAPAGSRTTARRPQAVCRGPLATTTSAS
jgi:hypothetical protein